MGAETGHRSGVVLLARQRAKINVASKGNMYVSIAEIRGCSSTRSTHASYAYARVLLMTILHCLLVHRYKIVPNWGKVSGPWGGGGGVT